MKMSYWSAPGQFQIKSQIPVQILETSKFIHPDVIKKIVSSYFDVTYSQIIKKDRHANFVYARNFLRYFLHVHGKLPLSIIAKYMRCDHTTVIYGRNLVKSQLSLRENNPYKEDYLSLHLIMGASIHNNA